MADTPDTPEFNQTDRFALDELIRDIDSRNDVMRELENHHKPDSFGTFHGKDRYMPASAGTLKKPLTLALKRKYKLIAGLHQETLNALIPELPPEDTELLVLNNGGGAERKNGSDSGVFDFGDFIPYFVHMLAPEGNARLFVSTWTMNQRGAVGIVDLIQSGAVAECTICTDPYFNSREPEISAYLLHHMRDDNHHYIAFRNHAKIICASNADGSRAACVTGSANLSSQRRVEQFNVHTSKDVYQFYVKNLFQWAISQVNNG